MIILSMTIVVPRNDFSSIVFVYLKSVAPTSKNVSLALKVESIFTLHYSVCIETELERQIMFTLSQITCFQGEISLLIRSLNDKHGLINCFIV